MIQGECSMPSNIFLCNPAQRLLYTVTYKHQSLFHTIAGVQTGDLLVLRMLTNTIVIFLSFFLHPVPCSIPSFLNVTVLHDSVFKKAVYSQTRNWLLVG
jgi:hypothetical protein